MAMIYYSVDEAAKILKIPLKKLWGYVHKEEIKSTIIKNRVQISAEDLQSFIKKSPPVRKPSLPSEDPARYVDEYLENLGEMEKNL